MSPFWFVWLRHMSQVFREQRLAEGSRYEMCEGIGWMGRQAFQQRKYQESLKHFRSVLDQDPLHMEIYPLLIWNCVQLGLMSDAKVAERIYRQFHQQQQEWQLYRQLCHNQTRYLTLQLLCEKLISGQSLEDFRSSWKTLRLPCAEFMYDVLFAVDDFLHHDYNLSQQKVKELYRQFSHEGIPAVLWAISAFENNDLAVCDEMLGKALECSPGQHHFLKTLRNMMFLDAGSRNPPPLFS